MTDSKIAPIFHQVRIKSKTNNGSLVHLYLCFLPTKCNYFDFYWFTKFFLSFMIGQDNNFVWDLCENHSNYQLTILFQVIIWKETSNGWANIKEFCIHDSSGKDKRLCRTHGFAHCYFFVKKLLGLFVCLSVCLSVWLSVCCS